MLTRRLLLKKSLMLPAALQLGSISNILSELYGRKFKIGACDWSIGKWSSIEAFAVAKEIGVDGIMVDVGAPSNNLHLRQKSVQEDYLKESKQTGIAISSLALGVFNQVPFHSHAETEQWVSDSIDAAKALNVKVLLLAFFNASDLRNDDKRKDAAVRILKNVIAKAEANGVTLGIESYLNAKEHIEIIDRVGSKNVKVYYDFRNTADAGFDTVEEFKKLGKDLVCELHMKENGFLLDKGTINWKEVSKTVYDMGYHGDGWMQIEGALPKDAEIVSSYKHNLSYLKGLFGK
ncbi:MAG: sugar phosphate isomerase/epimerase [Chitinophagaceae bacterium]|nr:sugar phosphate isomerase/epimerase [Chitinophagaceae bacterium]